MSEITLSNPFVFKVLDISTGHMTKEDAEKLSLNDPDKTLGLPSYELDEYGWLVYIGEMEDNWANMSPEFNKVLTLANDLGCDYVRFDRDGREYPELPSFDW